MQDGYWGVDGFEFERKELNALEYVIYNRRAEPINLTLRLLKRITNNFDTAREIGRGAFAVVYLGVLPSGLRIAVKKLFQSYTIEEGRFQDEVSNTLKVVHKNIVRLIGYCSHTEAKAVHYDGRTVFAEVRERLICMEYVPNRALDMHITDIFHGLDWNQRFQILKGICQGLHYLHEEARIIHGDIKPANIMLEDDLVPKIGDFGSSRSFSGGDGGSASPSRNFQGTTGYMAPEAFDGAISTKSDIFSLGVTMMWLLIGLKWSKHRGVEKELQRLRKRLLQEGVYSSWGSKYQQVRTCLDIGFKCMDADPDKRPNVWEIIKRLHETESLNNSATSGHGTPIWQSGDEESDSSDTDAFDEDEAPSDDFCSSDEEHASTETDGGTNMQDHDKLELVTKMSATMVELSSLDFLEKTTDNFSHERIVASGEVHKAFVYKGNISGLTVLAVKRYIDVEIPVEKFEREAKLFKSLNHKNIVKLVGYYYGASRSGHKLVQYKEKVLSQNYGSEPEQLLCYEYMPNGSLRNYLIGQGSQVDWHMRYKIIKGTCDGLHYLHEGRENCPVVHLNLSPSNVFLDENYAPRITGFDFAKLIGEKNTKSFYVTKNRPLGYQPPDFEYSKGTNLKYLATVDIYSLGLMILEVATRQEKADLRTLVDSVKNKWREESQIASLYTPALEGDIVRQAKLCIDIGLHCVKSKPEERPTTGDIIRWLNQGSKRVHNAGVPKPPVGTNMTHVYDHIQDYTQCGNYEYRQRRRIQRH
ncbi:receptor like protein kinase S.2 isoform X1 [Brachypodium distachyon]|uniref:receptor like protein kinase S.2 isoform X1 n=1 Tax=Brachypodium distachyon TaxID=15368 RepID=UPI000D0DA2E3|nr:receptor like protein kinase S.2 isoform X1 [Brachypodium distachyon]XP_024311753.1 receptor like protein kinase S.2 isoform X1 [Brachypodium distachyon]XP_024311754.1 receptor like protein kinase S.2 isoform X1 [Brachypodium distachyon]|eukprot:XP_024311752.1 receptor like protein kinase S.2 isoform X1 [Brachypodium distachyon]